MSETLPKEMVVEEAQAEVLTEVSVEEVKEATPTAKESQIVNYLDADLFKDVKVVEQSSIEEVSNELEIREDVKEKYFETFSDITEHQVISGRVIGINEKEILVDIGFKSEGIIERTEF